MSYDDLEKLLDEYNWNDGFAEKSGLNEWKQFIKTFPNHRTIGKPRKSAD